MNKFISFFHTNLLSRIFLTVHHETLLSSSLSLSLALAFTFPFLFSSSSLSPPISLSLSLPCLLWKYSILKQPQASSVFLFFCHRILSVPRSAACSKSSMFTLSPIYFPNSLESYQSPFSERHQKLAGCYLKPLCYSITCQSTSPHNDT